MSPSSGLSLTFEKLDMMTHHVGLSSLYVSGRIVNIQGMKFLTLIKWMANSSDTTISGMV
jgi:hypothetical protein